MGEFKTEGPGGNYMRKLERMWAEGKIPRGQAYYLTILHEGECAIFGGKPCDCDADIRVGLVSGGPDDGAPTTPLGTILDNHPTASVRRLMEFSKKPPEKP